MINKKVLFITTGTEITASSRTRGYNYRPFLEKDGFNVKIIPYNTRLDCRDNVLERRKGLAGRIINKIHQFYKCLFYLSIAAGYDVIFIQRVLFPVLFLKLLKRFAKKIIFDFDDAIYLADSCKRGIFNKKKFGRRFKYTLSFSDRVIVSNNALKNISYAINKNTDVLPTPVDTQRLVPVSFKKDNGAKVVIGWIGSAGSTKYIESLKDVFKVLTDSNVDLSVKLIGAQVRKEDWGKNIYFGQWILERELETLQGMDIGVMPLSDDEWSLGKGGYKLLQYMAVGIPSVASPVGINKEIIEDGLTGFLAQTQEEWIEKLFILIKDKELRERMGKNAREKAEKLYSYNANSPKLAVFLSS